MDFQYFTLSTVDSFSSILGRVERVLAQIYGGAMVGTSGMYRESFRGSFWLSRGLGLGLVLFMHEISNLRHVKCLSSNAICDSVCSLGQCIYV